METNVIIAGAGVSVDAPSSFPMAIPLINAIIGSLAPNDLVKIELLKKDIREGISHECKLSGDFLRFEMLVDAISLVDKDLYVLDAIKNYKNPNLNHFNLAKLAIEGHYVFTPNFDDLIERAIYELGYNPQTICTKRDYEAFGFRNKKAIPVFKLHGSYYKYIGDGNKKKCSKKTLQASLTSIISKNSLLLLDEHKAKFLGNCIEKSSKLVFVGYSGSDDFDIVPSLMTMDIGRILWINHSDIVCFDNVVGKYMDGDNGRARLLSKQVKKMSGTAELFDTNTRLFLSGLGGITELKNQKTHKVNISFEEHIIEWSKQLKEEEKHYIIGKVYQGLDFYDKALEMFKKVPRNSEYYIESQQQLSFCLDQRGRYKEALQVIQALKAYKDIESKKEYLEIIQGEAYLMYRIASNNSISEKLFKEVVSKADKKTMLLPTAMNNYGLFLRDRGRTVEAMRYFSKSYKLFENQGSLRRQSWVACNIACLLYDKGEMDKAGVEAKKGIIAAEMLGDQRQVGVFENLLANISFISGDIEGAIEYCERSISRDKFLGNEVDSSVNELLMGQCYFEKEEYDMADFHYSKADKLFLYSDDKFYLYELLFYKIVYYLKISNPTRAGQELKRFSEVIDQTENVVEVAYYNIAEKMVDFFLHGNEVSFKEDLYLYIKDRNNKEIIGFINMVWYLMRMGIPQCLIGKQYIQYVLKTYCRIGNWARYEFINSKIQ